MVDVLIYPVKTCFIVTIWGVWEQSMSKLKELYIFTKKTSHEGYKTEFKIHTNCGIA